ncbi:disulfide bond formation protein B [Bartonella sp. DGB1]|uniref:disulfide bond formation protein B n=1 Tax=Bartonella sp. DGB1 TaxID=3239807 RepID=UPI003524959F
MVREKKDSHKIDIQFLFNILGLASVVFILIVAFYLQFVRGELPCPLCLLQRAGFALIGVGLLMNIRYGISLSHYAMSILGALAAAGTALRQIALHVNDDGFGQVFINNWHYYTWSFVLAVIAMIAICLVMMLPCFEDRRHISKRMLRVGAVVASIFFLVVLLNFVFTIFQCKLGLCPPDSKHYELFSSVGKNFLVKILA